MNMAIYFIFLQFTEALCVMVVTSPCAGVHYADRGVPHDPAPAPRTLHVRFVLQHICVRVLLRRESHEKIFYCCKSVIEQRFDINLS